MIRLEEFTPADFEQFIKWVDSELFMYQFCGPVFTFPITNEQLDQYISDTNRKVYKVVDIQSKSVIGHGEISCIDQKNKSARLSRLLIANKEDRNKGYGGYLVNELLMIAFSELLVHRVDLGVFDYNTSAIRCYEGCGFKSEGTLRDSFLIGDEFVSVLNMSILRPEWVSIVSYYGT